MISILNLIQDIPVNQATKSFLDYGVIGAVVVFLGVVSWKLYQKIDENAADWKKQAKYMQEKYAELYTSNLQNQKTLINIREKDVQQSIEHNKKMERKMAELPAIIIKELKYEGEFIQKQSNKTSAG